MSYSVESLIETLLPHLSRVRQDDVAAAIATQAGELLMALLDHDAFRNVSAVPPNTNFNASDIVKVNSDELRVYGREGWNCCIVTVAMASESITPSNDNAP